MSKQNRVGLDKDNLELALGDICTFTLKGIKMEGMIMYDEEYFAHTLEIDDSIYKGYIALLMSIADYRSIEKVINIGATKTNDDRYKFYREIWNK